MIIHRMHQVRFAMVALAVAIAVGLGACPKETGSTETSGSTDPKTWVGFVVTEMGTGNPVVTYVWVEGHKDDFEVVAGGSESNERFFGFGKTETGYVVPFGPKQTMTFHAWSDGYELATVEIRLSQGENLIPIDLRRTEIEDERVPEKIRLDMIKRLPTEKPKTGS